MENASTALLIAGGILLAILSITMLVYAFDSLATLGNAAAEKEDAQRLAEWNAEWEAYNKTILYGADIITVKNKAKEFEGTIYEVNIIVDTHGEINNKAIYKCVSMNDTNNDGRIDEIKFANANS